MRFQIFSNISVDLSSFFLLFLAYYCEWNKVELLWKINLSPPPLVGGTPSFEGFKYTRGQIFPQVFVVLAHQEDVLLAFGL